MTKSKISLKIQKNQAQKWLETGNLEQARHLLEQVVRQDPADAESWSLLAAVNGTLGRYDAAISNCRTAIDLRPSDPTNHHNLAQALMYAGRREEAVQAYTQVIQYAPQDARALNNLGAAYVTVGKFTEAASCFEKATRLCPDYFDARINLARAYSEFGHPDKAVDEYRTALKLKPDDVSAHHDLASTLMMGGRVEEAEDEYRWILRSEPENNDARAGLAMVYMKTGDFDICRDLLQPILASGNEPPLAAIAYAHIAPRYGESREAVTLLERIVATVDADKNLCKLHYQLGKLYESLGEYEKSFENYQTANRVQPQTTDPLSAAKQMSVSMRIWTPEFLARAPRAAHGSGVPVFIVGLPRSGTSLVEQILASHPDVFAAGELHELPYLTADLPEMLGTHKPYPECLTHLTQNAVDALAGRYLDYITKLAPGAARITDKMPSNYLHLGLIRLLFPGAKIIHCSRNPLDTCLSIYFNEFPLAAYTTDLNNLVTHYRRYRAMIRHWRDELGIAVLDLCYEELVTDPETVITRMLAYCGLEWHPDCLRFHENPRLVNTLSHDQVRRPMYRSSINRWQHYEQYIAPLIDGLKEEQIGGETDGSRQE